MQLSLHADYALRVLIYVGSHPQRVVPTHDIAEAYGISKNHLVRVVHTLAAGKYIRIHAGRSGGVTLTKNPHEIRLGQVIRDAESNLRLVECFDRATNTCPIAPACSLKNMLAEALDAFLATLDRYTLADIVRPDSIVTITQLLSSRPAATAATGSRAAEDTPDVLDLISRE